MSALGTSRGLAFVVLVAAVACHRDVAAPAVDAGGVVKTTRALRTVRVSSARGNVIRRRSDGSSGPIAPGDELAADDVVETGDGAARLDVGGVADVELAADTHVSIGELTDTLSRVKLRDGRIGAVVHGDARRSLQVDAPGSNATASASEGEFSMLASGSQLSVATKSGAVTLSARGQSVRIGSGQLSIVERGAAPTAPQAVPASLLLKLGAAGPTTTRQKTAQVRGATAPGAIVSVGGVRVVADVKGEFAGTVPLKEGRNDLVVESTDTLGRKQRAQWPRITVDTRAPDARSKVEW